LNKDNNAIYDYERLVKDRLNFIHWADTIFVSAMTGQRVEKILTIVNQASEQHRRRVSTSVINEVLQAAMVWRSPPATRQGRQGKIYYGTQVTITPPSITLFVNDPKLFNDNYRRYLERQFRNELGFAGTPIRLFWRGKPLRELERDQRRREENGSWA